MFDVVTVYNDRARRTLMNNTLSDIGHDPNYMMLGQLERSLAENKLSDYGVVVIEYNEHVHERIDQLFRDLISRRSPEFYWVMVLDGYTTDDLYGGKERSQSLHYDVYINSLISKQLLKNLTTKSGDLLKRVDIARVGLDEEIFYRAINPSKGSRHMLLNLLENRNPNLYRDALKAIAERDELDGMVAYHLYQLAFKTTDLKVDDTEKCIKLLLKKNRYIKECQEYRFRKAVSENNNGDAVMALLNLQAINRENDKLFTRLAKEAAKNRDLGTLKKSLTRYLATKHNQQLDAMILSLFLIVEETSDTYMWLKRHCKDSLIRFARRLPVSERDYYWACLLLIDAIGLLKCNKVVTANLRFEKVVHKDDKVLESRKENSVLWVLAMIYCSKAGKWKKFQTGLRATVPTNINTRLEMHLNQNVRSFNDDMKQVSTTIDSKYKAKRAIQITQKRQFSAEVMGEVSKNITEEFAITSNYLSLLKRVGSVQQRLNETEQKAGLKSERTYFDVNAELKKVANGRQRYKLAKATKESQEQLTVTNINQPSKNENWFKRTLMKIKRDRAVAS
ncbi:hypothetical protein [Vibrio sp. SCSIO 43155]|uniref:hypothetical protein n=1 Tax=Vibrio TaxID=662 RepID=UPI0020763302|nr:hypothetical protein [Vibrio sp. SCSIO 43155]USD58662.1 hypothetical protein J4N44_27300 [Vibrio sp. SCSIO 43155]